MDLLKLLSQKILVLYIASSPISVFLIIKFKNTELQPLGILYNDLFHFQTLQRGQMKNYATKRKKKNKNKKNKKRASLQIIMTGIRCILKKIITKRLD